MRSKGSTIAILATLCLTPFVAGCSSFRPADVFTSLWRWTGLRSGEASTKDVNCFISHIRPQPGNAEAHYNLGCYYQERDRHREAIEEFQKTVSIDPTNVKALNRLGVSCDEVRDFPRAVAAYQTALKIAPGVDYSYNNLAHSYRLQGRFEESVATFKKALAINSHSSRIHNNLGLVYTLMGQHELARKEFEQAIVLAKPGRSIEQAIDKQQLPTAVDAAVTENVKPAEDPFTRADVVQTTAATIAPSKKTSVSAMVSEGNAESQSLLPRSANTPPEAKAPVAQRPIASPPPTATKAHEGGRLTKVTKAVEIQKPSEMKRIVEVKKVVAKASADKDMRVVRAKPISVVLPDKRAQVNVRSSGSSSINPDRFYAQAARSIVLVRPAASTPATSVSKSTRQTTSLNILIRNDLVPSARILLEDYT